MISYGAISAVLPFRLSSLRRTEATLEAMGVDQDSRLLRMPWRAFKNDVLAWTTAGAIMVAIYALFFLPVASANLKVFAGCTALGILCGMLRYLSVEKRVIQILSVKGHTALRPGRAFTLSRKIFVLIGMMLGLMALTVLMMVWLDVYYLLDQDVSKPDIYWGIFKEIAFVLTLLLGVSVFIIKRYAANLAQVMEIQLAAMDEISRGNLERQVPVLTRDEFSRYAQKTNEMMVGLQERDYCRTSFEKYISPEVSDKILQNDIGVSGEKIDVTVLFCDLRDYTAFAEKRDPQEVVAFMNYYFSAMEPVIRKHGGVVIQFLGDEIEAVFGAPKPITDHADRAVQAAREMEAVLDKLNEDLQQKGELSVRQGIGIHTGIVLAGNVGSPERMSYALVGDTVNLASRVQVLNKTCDTHTLLTRGTHDRLNDENKTLLRNLGRYPIRGKSEEVEVFTIVSPVTNGN